MNPSNYSVISFPALGIELNPPRGFSIGPLYIHFYGVIIACGLILAVVYACRRSREAGLTEDSLLDGVLWITPFSIVCARAYYCVFSWPMYRNNPISVLYIWEGGLAIYGAVLGAAVGVIVFCKIKKCSLPALLDLVSLGFLIGQFIGRWGNFFNREAFGAATDAVTRMGLFNTVTGVTEYYHPTFLYESVWNLAGFLLLHFLSRKKQYDGQIALGYCAWYGLGRAFIEGLRMDSLYWGPFRVSQLLAAGSCAVAVAVLLVQAFRPHDAARLAVNRTAVKAAEAAEDITEAEKAPEAEETAETTEVEEAAQNEEAAPSDPENT
ncbi:MAG: prolipoprotein diacylglyceryl transferase [Oscillospiraceae bacterium]|nr:prolipoprotein diacylglyceryl transferase [Oscillospiraceae bacterium]